MSYGNQLPYDERGSQFPNRQLSPEYKFINNLNSLDQIHNSPQTNDPPFQIPSSFPNPSPSPIILYRTANVT